MAKALTTTNEEALIERLGALLACDGSPRMAARRLKAAGTEITERELRDLRDEHAGMYQALAAEVGRAQEEAIAQEFRELVRLGQRATKTFLVDLNEQLESEEGIDGMDRELRRQLPQIVQALAKVQQVGTDKLLSITGRPADGGGGDTLGSIRELVELGILVPRERPSVDSTAEEAP